VSGVVFQVKTFPLLRLRGPSPGPSFLPSTHTERERERDRERAGGGGALVLLSSCVSLILVVSLVTRPYVRASGFVNATCSPSVVSEGSRDGHVMMQTCSCGKGCNSKYRCIRIHVRYTPVQSGTTGAVNSAVLYDDETALGRQVTALYLY